MNQEIKIGQRWITAGELRYRCHLTIKEIEKISEEYLNSKIVDLLQDKNCRLTKTIHIGKPESWNIVDFKNRNTLLRGQDRISNI
jgi:hypothetical protein